jgi:hypothetical protein
MGTQHYRSLRIFQELTPPAAFDKADATSYVPFKDPAAADPASAPLTQCQGIGILVNTADVEFSFDGTTVHGKVTQADGYVFFPGIREREIYFQAAAGSNAKVRVWAW